jgi:hypothetical protein
MKVNQLIEPKKVLSMSGLESVFYASVVLKAGHRGRVFVEAQ